MTLGNNAPKQIGSKQAVRQLNALRYPGRRYRKFRHQNRYNTPLLIFLMDSMIWLLKTIVALVILVTIWVVITKYTNSPSVAETDTASSIDADTVAITTTPADDPKLTKASSEEPAIVTQPLPDKADTLVTIQQDNTLQGMATDASPIRSNKSADTVSLKPLDAKTPDLKPDIKDEKWILGMNSTSYVIQFGSSTDTTLFEEFIPVINNGDPISVYPYKLTPSGRPVYGIASGIYNSHKAAAAAVETYSAEARAYKPWIRKVATLINQIDSAATDQQNLQ